eukprot:TRINITY_DN66355_c7_g5_i1.p1 TRINITY_DN66355_c7_g5~~TRINITY_DN66355_c7_g5_i1.p1  ORF type:complete len:617 (-),score=45.13 TRINITY_DN66355_c7_g5_i1:573-2423(-)
MISKWNMVFRKCNVLLASTLRDHKAEVEEIGRLHDLVNEHAHHGNRPGEGLVNELIRRHAKAQHVHMEQLEQFVHQHSIPAAATPLTTLIHCNTHPPERFIHQAGTQQRRMNEGNMFDENLQVVRNLNITIRQHGINGEVVVLNNIVKSWIQRLHRKAEQAIQSNSADEQEDAKKGDEDDTFNSLLQTGRNYTSLEALFQAHAVESNKRKPQLRWTWREWSITNTLLYVCGREGKMDTVALLRKQLPMYIPHTNEPLQPHVSAPFHDKEGLSRHQLATLHREKKRIMQEETARQATKRPPPTRVHLPVTTTAVLLWCYASNGDWPATYDLLQHFTLDAYLCTVLFKCAAPNLFDPLVTLMKARGIHMDDHMRATVRTVLWKHGKLQASDIRLGDDLSAWELLITDLTREPTPPVDKIRALIAQMEQKGLTFRSGVCVALLKMYARLGYWQSLHETAEWWTTMGRISQESTAYCLLIKAFGDGNHIEIAEGYYNEMLQQGMKPTVISLCCLLGAYKKVLHSLGIQSIIEKAAQHDVEMDDELAVPLVLAFGEVHDWQGLQTFVKLLKSKGLMESPVILSKLLKVYHGAGRESDWKRTLDQLNAVAGKPRVAELDGAH